MAKELGERIEFFKRKLNGIKGEIKKGILGQEEVMDTVLKGLVCNGHVLLEGVPGLAKTLLVRLMTQAIGGAEFQRIQFTPDLLPSDITGTRVYRKKLNEFRTKKGPLFANFILADEINRTTPKVQSAMLQAMQEREVTIGKKTFSLPEPFMVLATQNPLEQAGTYPLAVAQVDRFLFKIFVDYPSKEEEMDIIDHNIEVMDIEEYEIEKVISHEEIKKIQGLVKDIKLTDNIKEYIMNIVEATRDPEEYGLERVGRYVRYGASTRASIFLGLAGKATALMNGRTYVIPEDVREVALPVLRHRMILNYEGRAKELNTDDMVRDILARVEVV